MSFDLQQFLNQSIPISEHMKLQVGHHTDRSLTIHAPLQPNRNDKETAFAGSLYSTMVLSGWVFVTNKLREAEIDGQVVVVSADIQYLKPVTRDFAATCRLPEDFSWEAYFAKLHKRKNYKIKLTIDVAEDGEFKAKMAAEYIAWLSSLKPF